mmetsp:Transcript_121854/g.351792  ORF Transcript_121854/g.351792 Transcript_121854/m.351792 type:complete len:237 (-) Transcript_121854:308-1018(-)
MASMLVAGCGTKGTCRWCPGTSSPKPEIKHRSTKASPAQPDRASHVVVAETYVGVDGDLQPCRAENKSYVAFAFRVHPPSARPQKWIHALGLDAKHFSTSKSMLPEIAATPANKSEASQANLCIMLPPIEKPNAMTLLRSTPPSITSTSTAALAIAMSSVLRTRGISLVARPVFQLHGLKMSSWSPAEQQASSHPRGQQMSLSTVGLVPNGKPTTKPYRSAYEVMSIKRPKYHGLE